MCYIRMFNGYKQNMLVIHELEKAYYGNDSYFHLVETGQYHELQHEGDYSGPAVVAATQNEDAEGNDSDNVKDSLDNDNDVDSNRDSDELGEESECDIDSNSTGDDNNNVENVNAEEVADVDATAMAQEP